MLLNLRMGPTTLARKRTRHTKGRKGPGAIHMHCSGKTGAGVGSCADHSRCWRFISSCSSWSRGTNGPLWLCPLLTQHEAPQYQRILP